MRGLRLQMFWDYEWGRYAYLRYRWARDNGWHCGHWHTTVEDATSCVQAKF